MKYFYAINWTHLTLIFGALYNCNLCVFLIIDKKVIIDTSSRTFYIDIHEINSDIITSQSNLGITQRTCSYQKR